MKEATTSSSLNSVAALNELMEVMRTAQPPWAHLRGQYVLRQTPWLDRLVPVAVMARTEYSEPMVLISEGMYRVMQQMDWGHFGPPNDDELAAMLAHAVLTQKPKLAPSPIYGQASGN